MRAATGDRERQACGVLRWRSPAPLALVPGADAQDRRTERAIRQADTTLGQRIDPSLSLSESLTVDVGGFASLIGLNLTDEEANSRGLFQSEVALYGRVTLGGAHTGFVRARFRNRQFTPGDSFDGRGDQWTDPILERYWYEFDLRRQLALSSGERSDHNVTLRLGRQFVDWGTGISLSENLLGGLGRVSLGDRLSFDVLAGVTPADESVIDFDASRDEFDRKTRRGFFGGAVRYVTESGHSFFGYGLRMEDLNTDNTSDLLPGEVIDFDYSATYLGVGSSGSFGPRLAYLAELVYQLGESASDPLLGSQSREDISAFAGRFQLDVLFQDEFRTRLQLEALFATGDSDRLVTTDTIGGNSPGTTDTAFNSLGFVNTGLSFAPTLSNLWVGRAGVSTFPLTDVRGMDQFQVGADLFVFGKFDSSAPIDEPTGDDALLGFETDLYMNYRVTSDLAVNGRYGAFFPGDAIDGPSDVRHFVSLGITLSF